MDAKAPKNVGEAAAALPHRHRALFRQAELRMLLAAQAAGFDIEKVTLPLMIALLEEECQALAKKAEKQ